jgi:hypothetical protein
MTEDIACFPVWEYALDEEGLEGQDEATVRPVDHRIPLDLAPSSYFVRARFTLADETTHVGLVELHQIPGDPIIIVEGDVWSASKRRPVIVTAEGPIGFYFGALGPRPDDIARAYRLLGGRHPKAVFPIKYISDVSLPTGPVQGRIDGFQYLEDKPEPNHFILRTVT